MKLRVFRLIRLYIASMRWNLNWVCEFSRNMGLIDFHDFPDSTIDMPWFDGHVHYCKRCKKGFRI